MIRYLNVASICSYIELSLELEESQDKSRDIYTH